MSADAALRQIIREEITTALERAGLLCQHTIGSHADPASGAQVAYCIKCGSLGPFTFPTGGGTTAGQPGDPT